MAEPTRPPPSWPLATSAPAPAVTAVRASAAQVTSAHTRGRPAAPAHAATRSGVWAAGSASSTVSTAAGSPPGPSGQSAGTRTPYRAPSASRMAQLRETAPCGVGVPAEVEQPEGPGALGGGDDGRVGLLERTDRDDQITDGGGLRVRGGHGRSSSNAV